MCDVSRPVRLVPTCFSIFLQRGDCGVHHLEFLETWLLPGFVALEGRKMGKLHWQCGCFAILWGLWMEKECLNFQ